MPHSYLLKRALLGLHLAAAPLFAGLPGNYALVWADEFDGSSLNTSKWAYSNGARRDAVNTTDAVSVSNGALTIRTYTEGGTHYTGFVTTWNGNVKTTYGYWEARIRFTGQKGMWSAFWIQSDTINNTGNNPAANGAEIDVVEHRRYNSSGTDIRNLISTNIHWDGYGADHKSTGHDYSTGAAVDGQWHKYAVLWTSSGYKLYFDDAEYWSTSTGLSKRSEYIIFSSEVDTAAWAGPIPSGGYGSKGSSSNPKMEVDWVRVWQPNVAPAFKSNAALNGTRARLPYSGNLAAQVTDGNNGFGSYDELTFSKVSGPGWLDVASDGTLSGTPTPGSVGTNSFTLKVTDTGNPYSTTAPLTDETTLNLTVIGEPSFTDWSGPDAPASPVSRFTFTSKDFQNDTGGLVRDSATRLVPGVFDESALEFSGGGATAAAGSANAFPPGSDPAIVLSLWIAPRTFDGVQTLVDKGNAATLTKGYRLELDDNKLVWTVGGDTKTATATASLPLVARTWIRVDAIWDPGLDAAQLYVDGALAASAKVGGLVAVDSTALLRLGSRTDLSNPYSGRMDDLTLRGTPDRPLAPGQLVRTGTTWRYFDSNTSSPPSTWMAPGFDDSAWTSGTSPLGFGEDHLSATVDATSSRPTTWFRHSFSLNRLPSWPALRLRLMRDDGAVVYLNGVEVFRSNLPAGVITSSTLASAAVTGSAERDWQEALISGLHLRLGANVIAVEVHQNSATSSDLGFDLELAGEDASPAALVPAGSGWSYRDTGFTPSSTWKTTAYDASAWPSGPGPLGYGGSENTTVSYGANADSKLVSTWFRRSFTAADPAVFDGLELRLLCDDGAIVWLNGVEIVRENLPAGTLASGTLALSPIGGTAEKTWLTFGLPASLLNTGENILAAEMRQSALNSSDLIFDLSLHGIPRAQPRLETAPDANGLRLRWPSHWSGTRVWFSEKIGPDAVWAPLEITPSTAAGWSEVLAPTTSETNRFYRLGP